MAGTIDSGWRRVGKGMGELRRMADRTAGGLALLRSLHVEQLRSGHWFEELTVRFFAQRGAATAAGEASAEVVIRRAAIEAALLGAGAAGVTTAAEVITADSGSVAGLFVLPAAALAQLGDLVGRALLHLELVARLGELSGVRFDPADPAEVLQLFALAMGIEGVEATGDGATRGRGLIERLVDLDVRSTGAAVGARLLGETVVRNVIPFVDLATSSVASYRLTEHIGHLAHAYARARRAVDDAAEVLSARGADAVDALVEGTWLVLSAAHPLRPEAAALIAHLLRRHGGKARERLLAKIAANDEAGFHDRLRHLPAGSREPVLRALEVAAAVHGEVDGPQRQVLQRAADALRVPFDEKEVEALARGLEAHGEEGPEGRP